MKSSLSKGVCASDIMVAVGVNARGANIAPTVKQTSVVHMAPLSAKQKAVQTRHILMKSSVHVMGLGLDAQRQAATKQLYVERFSVASDMVGESVVFTLAVKQLLEMAEIVV